MLKPYLYLSQPASRQKPLVIAIRALIAGGLAVGLGTVSAPAAADAAHLPAGADLTSIVTGKPVAGLEEGQTVNLNPSYGTATETLNGHTLTIDTSNNAILNWNSFNIDKGYTVNFVEPSSSSVVVNNIGDQNASTILGTLTANGSVYLINQNGFIFEKGSEVNVGSLVASSLGISQANLLTGIANVFNSAYKANGSAVAALQGNGQLYVQDSHGNYVLDSSGNKVAISIQVQAGAQISTNAAGGLILMAAPSVNNQGTITAQNGQVILAGATDKVYLQDSTDANVRGMLVEVGTGGQVSNSGSVLAQTGNVSMIGFAVNQSGLVSATTSVALNGSVRLLAEEGIQSPSGTTPVLTGATTTRTAADAASLAALEGISVNQIPTQATVNLNQGSITRVDLDTTGATALAAQAQPKSYIEISGHNVNLFDGSLVQAHSGNVNIEALDVPVGITSQNTITSDLGKTDARIYLQTGSTIDVSGANATASVADDIVQVKLQSNELRDSPTQRTGVLYGQTVSVDIRDATISHDSSGNLIATVPIADITSAVQAIASNVEQRSVAGGTINLNSSGDVIVNVGSTLDIAGGSIAYAAGDITTTELYSDGQYYNIGIASPNLVYSLAPGQTALGTVTSHDLGYTQGAAGGTLNITTYAALLDGNLQGQTLAGSLQRQPSEWAAGSSVNISLLNDSNDGPQNVVFSNAGSGLTLGPTDALPLQNTNTGTPIALNLNASLTPLQTPTGPTPNLASLSQSGISKLTISTNGSLTVDSGVKLALPVAGSANLTAQSFDIEGSIVIPSGSINLHSGGANALGPILDSAAGITLGTAGLLDVSGLWVNDWLDSQHGQASSPLAINAGNVTLTIGGKGSLTMAAGSQIHADSGAWQQINAVVKDGIAGTITLDASLDGAGISLGGELSAWGLQQDGTLNLLANQVIIGSPAASDSALALVLGTDFFQQGAFHNYNITSSAYGLTVTDNTQLTLQQENRQLINTSVQAATGSSVTSISQPVLLAENVRIADNLSLSFSGNTYYYDNTPQFLTIGQGAKLQTDPGGSITLNSISSIFEDGTIDTPAGKIAMTINLPTQDTGYIASQGIWLGASSQLQAGGVFVPQINLDGLNTGSVLAGGSVSLTANRGYIVSEARLPGLQGPSIDVSGTSAVLDVIQGNFVNKVNTPSAGGSINFTAGEGILLDGNLRAQSGGSGAAGGSLTVDLNASLLLPSNTTGSYSQFPDQINTSLSSTLVVTANIDNTGHVVPTGLSEGGNVPLSYADQAWLKSSTINTGGFDSVNLQTDAGLGNTVVNSAISFQGNVELDAGRQIILDTPTLETQTANQTITLNAPYVALGSSKVNGSEQAVLAPAAVSGSGVFNVVNAQGIDLIGGLSFNGFDQVYLTSLGDLRMIGDANTNTKTFLGELNVAGNLSIKAGKIYPATLTDYTLNVSQTATFQSSGANNDILLTAGGALTVNAEDINQQGDIEAPFGSITLNATDTLTLANGSVTLVSGAGTVVPFGEGSANTIWLYPLNSTGTNNIVVYDATTNNLPQKSLQLEGLHLDLQKGATINLSGGGDLYGYEFITGSGGSNDVLNTPVINPTTGAVQQFAVLPGINNILTPYDPQQYSAAGLSIGQNMGQSVYLNAGDGLAAGWYTLLPAHYALLPGAFLITPESGSSGQTQTSSNASGDAVVAGYYGIAGTSIQNVVTQGFEVQSGAIFTGSVSYNSDGVLVTNSNADTPSQFNAYLASTSIPALAAEYGNLAPQLPQDGGSLLIAATNSLTLDATLLAASVGSGQGGQVDISGDNLVVVGNSQDLKGIASGTVGLLASQLSNFNAPSLLLGGRRSLESNGQHLLTITANTVTVDSDVQKLSASGDNSLHGQEILLAASNQVTVAANAQVSSTAAGTGVSGGNLILENSNHGSDGALLRVSAAGEVNVVRDLPITGSGGQLEVDAGAVLQAAGSMLLDSSQNTIFNGTIDMSGGALALDASNISLGAAPKGATGLVLASLPSNLDSLSFNSTGALNIYGNFAINSNTVNISAAAINGFNNAGNIASIASITAANQINLANSGATSTQTGTGTGELDLTAPIIQLGSGHYAINGFDTVKFTASQAINGVGATVDAVTGNSTTASPGFLTVAGNIDLAAGYFSGGNGATTTINAGNHHITLSQLKAVSPTPGLGVSWTLSGGAIDSSANFALPSGILSMTATSGDINLNSGSTIDLSGREVAYGSTLKYSPGGSLTLVAEQGNVNVNTGVTINLAGDVQQSNGVAEQFSNAGTLTVTAANGLFNWNGAIDAKGGVSAAGGVSSGNFNLDVADFGSGGLSALNTQLAAAGFTNDLNLEQQLGNVNIVAGDTVTAHQLQLTVDQGSVTIAGNINASGATAGSVSIYGANGITLEKTGKIDANATAANNTGGSVTLDTVARNGTTAGSGVLDLSAAGGVINVAGGSNGAGGSVLLRTGRNDSNDTVAVTAINTRIIGGNPLDTVLEATRVYADINAGSSNANIITADNIDSWMTDTATFMNNAPQLVNNSGGVIELLPGIEVRSSGNLTLASNWDFMAGGTGWSSATNSWNSGWRYGGDANLPGFLTLRASGDLNIDASISDGIAATPVVGQSKVYQDMIQPGLSWSYNLVAGGNVNLAASAPTASGSNAQVVVRTGTGAIQIQAGQNIAFNIDNTSANLNSSNDASAVYTVGTTALYNTADLPALAGLSQAAQLAYLANLTQAQLNQDLRYGLLPEAGIGSTYLLSEYPTNGGNISLTAGGNIQGQQTGQAISDWLVTPTPLNNGNYSAAIWGINISGSGNNNFNQNVGALGGGNVTVQAGGNINDLSVMIPTTGKPLGEVASYGRRGAITWEQSETYINGGGNLQLTAGNDITAGEYYLGLGTANLVAGGSITQDSNNPAAVSIGTILDVGNAVFNVQARQDLQLETAMNPTVLLPDSQTQGTAFFSYGTDSAVNLLSTAGNVVFLNDAGSIKLLKSLSNIDSLASANAGYSLTVYPGIVSAAALSGDIRIDNTLDLFPSVDGSLQLLANGNIGIDAAAATGLSSLSINMSDVNPSLLPSIQQPIAAFSNSNASSNTQAYLTQSISDLSLNSSAATTLIQSGNQSNALIVANQGSISFPGTVVASLSVPTAADVIAGGNITDFNISTQNQLVSDVTTVQAGGNISYDTSYDANGNVSNGAPGITVAGPGQLQVNAGRNVNLGSSNGIQSVGNLYNLSLSSSTGAGIEVLAGAAASKIDYANFISKYQTVAAYLGVLENLAGLTSDQQNQLNTGLSANFQEILLLESQINSNADRQTVFDTLLPVLAQEIQQSLYQAAIASPSQLPAAYQQGLNAISALFPGSQYQGSLGWVISQINQLVPGDNINNVAAADYSQLAGLFSQALANINPGSQNVLPVSGWIDYAGFINQYAAGYSTALSGLSSLSLVQQSSAMDGLLSNLAVQAQQLEAAANLSVSQQLSISQLMNGQLQDMLQLSNVSGLTTVQQNNAVINVLFDELRLSASAAASAPASQRYALYQQGYQALYALLPGLNPVVPTGTTWSNPYNGSINMIFSQIKTTEGGDVNLLTPGGGINVGLAGGQTGNNKGADQLGILVEQQGNLNVFTQNDVNVNQSRVFTEGFGSITAWSSAGNIDAGKGAKSAISVSPAQTTVSANGQISIYYPPIISGSGIQAVGGGNVYLAAPVGIVDAGEAGISGKDIVIAAVTVLGQSNISATGTTVGVPTAVAPPVGLAGADSAAAGASKAGAQTTTSDNNGDNDQAGGKQKSGVTILTTDVIGFGKCTVSDVKNGVSGCGG